MKRIKRILTLLLALATALSLAACGTQKDEPAAGDDGAAAEEKKLVIYSAATDAQVNAVVPLFEERYGIEVEVITGGTGELLARIDAEGDAPYCDVIFGGGESSYSEYKHVFQDYVSPEDANLIESCRNTLGYCTNYNLDSAILMYNTDLIGDIQIKGYKDLLNPELKGKIAMGDPTASSSAMMHIETILTDFGGLTLENEEGWNFVSDLIKNLDGKLASGSSAAWKSVADGEMTVVLTYEEAGISLARSGANVAIVYPEEGTVLTPGTVGLIKNCSHPENGKLFIDFVLSQEVQNILCNDLDLRPVRDDVSYPDYFRPASDIKTVALDQQYVNEHKAEIVDIARGFARMGVELFATAGTCQVLTEAGIDCKPVARVSEAHPNISDMIASGTVDLIINTPTNGRRHESDGFRIRRMAVEHSVACVTTIDTARAMLTVRAQSRSAELRPIDITEI